MPLYEYRCLKCEHVVEVLQKTNDKPLRKCELCSGKLEKLISRTSFQLKGGGWFDQGYGSAKSSDSKAAEGSSSDSKAAEGSSSDSSASKSSDKKKKGSKTTKASTA